ncbi:MAG: TonB-dependent receptor [Terriglobia bacterium]
MPVRILICLLALAALSGPMFSAPNQGFRIEGTVKDAAGYPVPRAAVSFKSGSVSQSTLTDNYGHFALSKIKANHGMLTAQAKGFGTAEHSWQSTGQGAFRITLILPISRFPQQVTVTATRTEMLVSEVAGSVMVLSQKSLESIAAQTIDGALRQIPGFTLFRRTGSRVANPTTQGVSLRGVGASGASRGLVLENGIPLNDPFGGWVYWDRVPNTAVKQIEVAQGGASDLYGSDAMGGTINILTRRASHSEVSLDTSYGNENTPDASLWANTDWRNWGAQFEAEVFRTDGYILVPQDQRGSVDTAAGSSHLDGTLTVDRRLSDRARAFLSGTSFGEARRNGTVLQTNRTHLRQVNGGLDWESSGLGALELRGYAETQIFDQTFSAIAPSRNSEALASLQRVPAQEVGYSVQWTRLWGTRQTWLAGAEGLNVQGTSNELHYLHGEVNSTVDSGGKQHNIGIFGEDIIRLTPQWILTVSGRFDRWRNFDALSTNLPIATLGPEVVTTFPMQSANAFSPHVSILRQLTSTASVYASAYRAFRAPTLNELYRSFRVGNVLTLANSNLTAEHLTGAEVGGAFTPWKDQLRLHATIFWNQIEQPIANVTLGATPSLITRQRQNLGSTRSRGFELEAEARLHPNFILSGGYQFADATVLDFPADAALEGLSIPQVPRNVFTMLAQYSRSTLTVSLQGRYTGVQYDDDLNQFPLDPAFTLDAFISHSIKHHAEAYGALENITGQRYQVARVPYTELGPPLLARIGIRFNWGVR